MLDVRIYRIPNVKGFQMGFEMMLQYGQDFIFVKKKKKKYLRKVLYQLYLLVFFLPPNLFYKPSIVFTED